MMDYIKKQGLELPEWLKDAEEYGDISYHTAKMLHLREMYHLKYDIKFQMDRDHVQFEYSLPNSYISILLNIFKDRRETWTDDGFTMRTSRKQYYGKQFINMILQHKAHYDS